MVQRSILSPGGSRAKRVQWTKQRRRGWRSALVFASAHRGAPRKPAKRKRARGKKFLSCAAGRNGSPLERGAFAPRQMPQGVRRAVGPGAALCGILMLRLGRPGSKQAEKADLVDPQKDKDHDQRHQHPDQDVHLVDAEGEVVVDLFLLVFEVG